jgi:hypothetical protein
VLIAEKRESLRDHDSPRESALQTKSDGSRFTDGDTSDPIPTEASRRSGESAHQNKG